MNDVKHEEDYESEDMDVYPMTEKVQHYKKLGTSWIWFAVALSFPFMLWVEYMYNHYPDVELWRKPLPPPLDKPDPFSTPDSAVDRAQNQNGWKMRRDAGVYTEPKMHIVNGKKVYDRFAGVNQPMEII